MRHKYEIPSWLGELKKLSWQAEMMLSGGLFLALLQLPEKIVAFQFFHYNQFFLSFLSIAIEWLIVGLFFHLVLRGFWIGLLGLSSVYDGIDRDRLNFAAKFQNEIENLSDLDKYILKIETISSLVFSITFLFFFNILGFLIYTTLFLTVAGVLDSLYSSLISVWVVLYLGFGFIYFVDFLTLGLVKKINWLSVVYYPVYKFFNILTLSFLYRNIYYTLITNIKKIYIILSIVLFLSLTYVYARYGTPLTDYTHSVDTHENYFSSDYYENLRTSNYVSVSIQSDMVSDNYIRLFIDRNQKITRTELGAEIYENQLYDSTWTYIVSSIYSVHIADSAYSNLEWKQYIHPDTKQAGFITFLDIQHLENGKHTLNILLNGEIAKELDLENPHIQIPFYKQ